ncbi:MAG TPA: hypothetical protein VHS06_12495 [Chloroflexota bacterium]|nr:hypothetical protein [Chloroflexota bacterium]
MTTLGLRQEDFSPFALAIRKGGQWRTIGKLVLAKPLEEIVLAFPYRNRVSLDHVSAPVSVLKHAHHEGAKWWVVRLDREGICLGLPMVMIPKVGFRLDEGDSCEIAVELADFEPIDWQDWPYVERLVHFPLEATHA